MALEHQHGYGSQWAAIDSIAGKMGCVAETLRHWVRQAERDHAGLSTTECDPIKALERENRELPQAHEILRKAAA